MTASAYDRILIRMAWLAPLALIFLNRWQMSLDRWYAPIAGVELARMSSALPEDAKPWLATFSNSSGKRLYLVVDPSCPCTKLSVKKVMEAIKATPGNSIALHVVSVNDSNWVNDKKWRLVLKNLPSTPTLIAVDGNQMQYAGPAVSGNLCIGESKIAGLSELLTRPRSTAINFVDWGCFCPIQHTG